MLGYFTALVLFWYKHVKNSHISAFPLFTRICVTVWWVSVINNWERQKLAPAIHPAKMAMSSVVRTEAAAAADVSMVSGTVQEVQDVSVYGCQGWPSQLQQLIKAKTCICHSSGKCGSLIEILVGACLECEYALHHWTRRQGRLWKRWRLNSRVYRQGGEATVLDDGLDNFTLKYTRLYF